MVVIEKLLKPIDGLCKIILPENNEFEEILNKKETNLKIVEKIEIKDNPKSKIIRVIYICKKDIEIEQPTTRTFPIYAKSYKEDPKVHRIYSNSYKHLLYRYCKHFDKNY